MPMITLLVSGGLVLLLDQCSKGMVRVHIAGPGVGLGPVLRIRHVRHVEPTYRSVVARALLVVTWLAASLAAVLLYAGGWFQAPVAVVGLGMALGGAAGNLIDILRLRYVVDFVDLRWWPVFNVADLAIVAGLVLAFVP
jgi:signal peptidase II